MENEKKGYEPPEIQHSLPVVSREVIESLKSEGLASRNAEFKEDADELLKKLEEENPEYFKEMLSWVETMEENFGEEAGAAALSTSVYLYELLRRQSMADKMKKLEEK